MALPRATLNLHRMRQDKQEPRSNAASGRSSRAAARLPASTAPPVQFAPLARSASRVDADAIIAELAARQHGVVARWQLLRAGITVATIEFRVRRGRLCPIHRGVYRVGPVSALRAREMAAVLACGEAAYLSHESAAVAWRLIDGPLAAGGTVVHVTAPPSRSVPGAGIRLYRSGCLSADERTVLDGIPISAPARTLLDLAGSADPADVEHALLEALRRRLVDRAGFAAFLERHLRRPGSGLLRKLLAHGENPQLTRSEAERVFRELIRKSRMRPPRLNVRVEGYEVDAFWSDERVVVEVDGFASHSSSAAFERDRRRDSDFAAAGVTAMRVTWRHLTREPFAVVARLAAALATARERLRAQER
jgi:very-short-patch-repair endonuclease